MNVSGSLLSQLTTNPAPPLGAFLAGAVYGGVHWLEQGALPQQPLVDAACSTLSVASREFIPASESGVPVPPGKCPILTKVMGEPRFNGLVETPQGGVCKIVDWFSFLQSQDISFFIKGGAAWEMYKLVHCPKDDEPVRERLHDVDIGIVCATEGDLEGCLNAFGLGGSMVRSEEGKKLKDRFKVCCLREGDVIIGYSFTLPASHGQRLSLDVSLMLPGKSGVDYVHTDLAVSMVGRWAMFETMHGHEMDAVIRYRRDRLLVGTNQSIVGLHWRFCKWVSRGFQYDQATWEHAEQSFEAAYHAEQSTIKTEMPRRFADMSEEDQKKECSVMLTMCERRQLAVPTWVLDRFPGITAWPYQPIKRRIDMGSPRVAGADASSEAAVGAVVSHPDMTGAGASSEAAVGAVAGDVGVTAPQSLVSIDPTFKTRLDTIQARYDAAQAKFDNALKTVDDRGWSKVKGIGDKKGKAEGVLRHIFHGLDQLKKAYDTLLELQGRCHEGKGDRKTFHQQHSQFQSTLKAVTTKTDHATDKELKGFIDCVDAKKAEEAKKAAAAIQKEAAAAKEVAVATNAAAAKEVAVATNAAAAKEVAVPTEAAAAKEVAVAKIGKSAKKPEMPDTMQGSDSGSVAQVSYPFDISSMVKTLKTKYSDLDKVNKRRPCRDRLQGQIITELLSRIPPHVSDRLACLSYLLDPKNDSGAWLQDNKDPVQCAAILREMIGLYRGLSDIQSIPHDKHQQLGDVQLKLTQRIYVLKLPRSDRYDLLRHHQQLGYPLEQVWAVQQLDHPRLAMAVLEAMVMNDAGLLKESKEVPSRAVATDETQSIQTQTDESAQKRDVFQRALTLAFANKDTCQSFLQEVLIDGESGYFAFKPWVWSISSSTRQHCIEALRTIWDTNRSQFPEVKSLIQEWGIDPIVLREILDVGTITKHHALLFKDRTGYEAWINQQLAFTLNACLSDHTPMDAHMILKPSKEESEIANKLHIMHWDETWCKCVMSFIDKHPKNSAVLLRFKICVGLALEQLKASPPHWLKRCTWDVFEKLEVLKHAWNSYRSYWETGIQSDDKSNTSHYQQTLQYELGCVTVHTLKLKSPHLSVAISNFFAVARLSRDRSINMGAVQLVDEVFKNSRDSIDILKSKMSDVLIDTSCNHVMLLLSFLLPLSYHLMSPTDLPRSFISMLSPDDRANGHRNALASPLDEVFYLLMRHIQTIDLSKSTATSTSSTSSPTQVWINDWIATQLNPRQPHRQPQLDALCYRPCMIGVMGTYLSCIKGPIPSNLEPLIRTLSDHEKGCLLDVLQPVHLAKCSDLFFKDKASYRAWVAQAIRRP